MKQNTVKKKTLAALTPEQKNTNTDKEQKKTFCERKTKQIEKKARTKIPKRAAKRKEEHTREKRKRTCRSTANFTMFTNTSLQPKKIKQKAQHVMKR